MVPHNAQKAGLSARCRTPLSTTEKDTENKFGFEQVLASVSSLFHRDGEVAVDFATHSKDPYYSRS